MKLILRQSVMTVVCFLAMNIFCCQAIPAEQPSSSQFMSEVNAEFSETELFRLIKKSYPEDYQEFLNNAYLITQGQASKDTIGKLGLAFGIKIRKKYGAYALHAQQDALIQIFDYQFK